MMNRARSAGLTLLAATALAACSSGAAATPATSLFGTTWRVVDIAGQPTFGNNPPTITFREGRLRGNSGCNPVSAPSTLEHPVIDGGSINSTLRLCEGDVAATETLFMRALIGANRVSFDDGGNLVLEGDGGDVHFVVSR